MKMLQEKQNLHTEAEGSQSQLKVDSNPNIRSWLSKSLQN